jgi:hypothetical protein
VPIADSTSVELHAAQRAAPQRARLRRAPGLGPLSAITVALDSRANSWRITVAAELSEASAWHLGELRVPPALTRQTGSRVVCIACCPGAVGWVVEALPFTSAIPPYDTAAPTETGLLEFSAADVGQLEPGIVAVGRAELVGARKGFQSGTMAPGNSQVTVPADRKIQRVSAWQVGIGGVFGIESYVEAVPIPPNGAASVQVDRFGSGAGAVWFVGIPAGGGGYVIEFLE